MLFDLTWERFKPFLLNDIKLSDKESSVAAEKSRFNKLYLHFHGAEFDRQSFNDFIGLLREKGCKPSYMNNFIKTGKNIDKFYNTHELQSFTYFKENTTWNGDTLTPEEISSIAEVNLDYRKKKEFLNKRSTTLYLLLGLTGCRISEALNLTFSDVYSASTPYVVFRDTKNSRDRQVPITSSLYDEIMSLQEDGTTIFISTNGKHLRSQEINIDLKRRAKACGINKRVYNHLFRHSFITIMKEAGTDIADISVLVGHEDPKTTARYTHGSLSYYSEILNNHPLLRSTRPWENNIKILRSQIDRIFDRNNYIVEINESVGSSLKVSINFK